jgi:hypothetical protein
VPVRIKRSAFDEDKKVKKEEKEREEDSKLST